MYFDNYEFRCSALGNIWSDSGKIIVGNETFLKELFISEIEGIRKEITSRYFEKGKYTEEDGISLLNDSIYKDSLIIKNKERKRNGWIHGEADCIAPDEIVYDIKNAWDRFTFSKACLTPIYEWQLRGYMWLWDLKHSRLFYCLNNMPEHLLVAEERKLFYANNFVSLDDEHYLELCAELRKKHNYDHLPLYRKFRVWDVPHDEAKIEKLKEKITLCRTRLNEMFDEQMTEWKKNKELMGEVFDFLEDGPDESDPRESLAAEHAILHTPI
jgi:hypothetical protein